MTMAMTRATARALNIAVILTLSVSPFNFVSRCSARMYIEH